MSIINTNYYILNKYSLDFNNILNNLRIDNNKIKDWCLQYDFINCQLQDLLKVYPKTPVNYSIIDTSVIHYNYSKMRSSTNMSVQQLNDNINDDNCFALLSKIKNIANNYDDLNKEQIFQNNYITKFKDVYSKDLYIFNYLSNNYKTNISSLFDLNPLQSQLLTNQSFFHLYFLKSLMNYYFSYNSNLKNNLINNVDTLTLDTSINIVDVQTDVLKIILINQYGFTNISNEFIDSFQTSQSDISTIFQDYIPTTFKSNFIQTFFDLFNHNFSFNFVDDIFNLSRYFNFRGLNALSYNLYSISDLSEFENLQIQQRDYATTLSDFEQQIVSYFQGSLNSYHTLKQYLYLLYLNRFQFEKFVNIIDLVANTYVSDNITLSNIYYFNKFSHLQNLFSEWKKNIYITNFQKRIVSDYTKDKQKVSLTQNIVKFAYIHEMYDVIENFIATDNFSDYLTSIQKEVYDHLRSTGSIDQNIDWCSCNIPLKVYFMSYLKEKVLDIDVTKVTEYILEQIDNSEVVYHDFDDVCEEFINIGSEKMFEFYQNMLTSTNGDVFSNAIHNIYKM